MLVGGGLVGILAVVAAMIFGVDPSALTGDPSGAPPPQDDEVAQFVSVVLAGTEDVWRGELARESVPYRDPKLVLYEGGTRTACGFGSATVGPFYCPADESVYLDLSFFRELEQRHDAPGDFAQAYVIAHEVGHHVQTVLGISREVAARSARASQTEANRMSVRQELQADCFAGVWAHHAQRQRQILEPGDVEEALAAASAIGDDALQRQHQGTVVPDSFTHGSSEQRTRWFTRGLQEGTLRGCDTFEVASL